MKFKRQLFNDQETDSVCDALQTSLASLIDLALTLKQAHWNVVGSNFRSLHLQLDEIIATTRDASDEIAERIVTLGRAPDGRVAAVADATRLAEFPSGLHGVAAMVSEVADRLMAAVDQLRSAIESVGKIDPISEDLLIGISSQQEKHLWMLQAQEVETDVVAAV